MADLRIDLAAEFRGRKAFKEADKSVSALDKSVNRLGKRLASVFAAQKVYAFGKASVKAFTEDQAAATKLAKVVDNLGLAFANPQITDFIQKLEKSSGIVDERLRPAFQSLLTTTGDVQKSMGLLNNAIDISRGSGIDLATVTQDLANGYVGITRGLKKYNLGLSQAQLKSKSFEEIMGLLNKQFSGSSAAYLNTYAGKMDVLTVAADNAKETIGKGLVDALILATGETTNVQGLADAMGNVATNVSDATVGLGYLVSGIKNVASAIPGLNKLLQFSSFGKYGAFGGLANLGKKVKEQAKPDYGDYAGSTADYQRMQNEKAAQKAADAAAKKARDLAKAQLKAQKALTDEQKKQAALKKAGTVFDIQQIELIAALKGNLSKDERTRAEAMLALLNGNDELATNLTKQILMAQDASGGLYKYFLSIGDAKINNPFAFLDTWIADFQKKLAALTIPAFTQAQTSGIVAGFTPTTVYPQGLKAGDAGFIGPVIPSTNASTTLPSEPMVSYNTQTGLNYNANANNINLTISGDSALTKAIADSLQVQSLSGIPSSVQRLVSTFG